MNDALIFLGILLFIFVLWIYSGGPTHPISFAGPYLTPVTNIGGESEAYGPTSFGRLDNDSGSNGSSGGSGGSGSANSSVYAGKIYITDGDAESTDPAKEYIVIRSSASTDVNISDWRMINTKTGSSETIPLGARIPKLGGGARLSPIVLSAGKSALLLTGSSPAGDSFEESTCTSVITTDQYGDCVQKHQDDTNFLTGNWYAYFGKNSDLWHKSESITLLDASGKVVDQYSY